MLNRQLYFGDKVTHANTEGFGDFGKCFQMNAFFGTLNLADIISSQIRFFGEFFLTQTNSNTLIMDCFTQNLVYARGRWHTSYRIKKCGYWLPTTSCLLCCFSTWLHKIKFDKITPEVRKNSANL
jgi:hypothetical protein